MQRLARQGKRGQGQKFAGAAIPLIARSLERHAAAFTLGASILNPFSAPGTPQTVAAA